MANLIVDFKKISSRWHSSSVSGVLIAGLLFFALVLSPSAIAANAPSDTNANNYALFVAPSSGLLLGSIFGGLFAGNRPDNLGNTDGQLQPCPNSPNCVSSQTDITDPQHAISPLSFTGSSDEAFAALVAIVKAQDNATVITEGADYLYAEFKTSLMGFVDDVEFVLNRDKNLIHVRSASRLGKSDLGLNRQRIETLRTALDRAIATGNA